MMSKNLDILEGLVQTSPSSFHPKPRKPDAPPLRDEFTPNLDEYHRIVLFTSAGKDSLACLLHLIDLGVDMSKVSLHHHRVDGAEGSTLMDWPCTDGYLEALAKAFGLPLYFSWRKHGFEGEMLRENSGTQPVIFTRSDGTLIEMGGERSKSSTRRKFPQVSANLSVRYCSGALKIDVAARLLVNDDVFQDGKTLVITGERAEESANRARYAKFEPHRNDLRYGRKPRWIDHWRPVHSWSTKQVWDIAERYSVTPFPPYALGWGRGSCAFCVFSSKNHWATLRIAMPAKFERIAEYEREFGHTIHRDHSVVELADMGTPFPLDPFWLNVATSKVFTLPIFMENWTLPIGAYGDSSGPT
jgi:3'-phosphoadenosine 5'-phosphosulfate sulfotransferase (PAPS reductase)/FAD synthetase